MTFSDRLRKIIMTHVDSKKMSLLSTAHNMTPLMIHMLANVHFSEQRARINKEKNGALYAELGEYKPYSRHTVNALRKRHLITIKAASSGNDVLYINATEKGQDFCERAYRELGEFDKQVITAA
jgi:hypothetical protein